MIVIIHLTYITSYTSPKLLQINSKFLIYGKRKYKVSLSTSKPKTYSQTQSILKPHDKPLLNKKKKHNIFNTPNFIRVLKQILREEERKN